MNERAPIAIFDSGVGSYSVVREIREQLPLESIVYFADRASFPYGDKTPEELVVIVEKSIRWLEERFAPKLIVVASNTPSLEVPETLQGSQGVQVVGIFPPLKEAEEKSKSGRIAVLGTRGTVGSKKLDEYIQNQNLADETEIFKVDASKMVELVESGIFLADSQETERVIRSVMDPILKEQSGIDVMTLSSTHLPFLTGYLERLYPDIAFLDPASSLAAEIKTFLSGHAGLVDREAGDIRVLATENDSRELTAENLSKTLGALGLHVEVEPTPVL